MEFKKIKLFETFAGYGGASFALKKAGIPFEVVGYSEIDKFAIQCYEQNHEGKNFGDISKINPNDIPDFDLLTGGFPCQDVSVAGKGDLSKGRTILFNEIIRIAEVKQPRWMLLENVKGLLSKRHRAFYEHTLEELNRIGYEVFMVYDELHKENRVPVLNSKDYGIPQNRERVWYVCFREHSDLMNFTLPEPEELKLFLKDLLEDDVDEKYYLSDSAIDRILVRSNSGKLDNLNGSCKTITAHNNYKGGRQSNIIQVNNPKHSNDRVYGEEGVSPTLNSMQGGNRQPFIKIKNATKKGFQEATKGDGINLEQPNSNTRRGRVQSESIGCLQTNDQRGVVTYKAVTTQDKHEGFLNGLTIRKLTPTECFRLMGFLKDEINLEGLSNTQRYKLAGNGWDINLVSKLFKEMFKGINK